MEIFMIFGLLMFQRMLNMQN